MIESKLKITKIDKYVDGSKNPFYGAQERKRIFEIINQMEIDKEDVAPCNVHLVLTDYTYSEESEKVKTILDIKANRYAFENSGDYYVISFNFETNVYELDVWFAKDENGNFLPKIENVILEEWLSSLDYEEARESDNIYTTEMFNLINENVKIG